MSDLPMQNRGGGGGQTPINPASLSVEDMSRILSGAGGAGGGKKITVEQIREDIEGGAPVGKDGRMNLVHYAAWLAREVQGENP
jgi:hypothetical protein